MAKKKPNPKKQALHQKVDRAAPKKVYERVKFKYVFPETYNPMYANGAQGGPTTMGEIAINFYVERAPLPLTETHAIGPDGRVAEQLERMPAREDKTADLIRFVTTGVILNLETAKRVHEWLGRHVMQMEAAIAGKQVLAKAASKK